MRTVLACAALALAACNPGFEPQYRVTDLRLLAVRARVTPAVPGDGTLADFFVGTNASYPSGQSLALEALVANPLLRTDLVLRWFACAPATGGELPPCLDPNALKDPASLVAAGAFELGQVSGAGVRSEQLHTPTIPLGTLPQPILDAAAAALATAQRRAADQPTYRCIIWVELPVVALAQAGAHQDYALKRLRLVAPYTDFPASGYVPNRNPVVIDARRAPSDENACTGGTALSALVGPPPAVFPVGRTTICGSSEPPGGYNDCDPDGKDVPTTETYGWQWYVTAGDFPGVGGIGNADGTHLELERPAEAFGLWAILRDGRGGSDWTYYDVPAAP